MNNNITQIAENGSNEDEFYKSINKNISVLNYFLLVIAVKAFLAFLAFISCLSLIWITFKHKMFGNCNLLIALNSLNTIIFLFGTIPPLIVLASRINFITFKYCLIFQYLPLLAFYSQIMLCLTIGLDRLIAVAFPIFYCNTCSSSSFVLICYLLLCYLFSLVCMVQKVFTVIETPNRLVICLATDIGLQSYITPSLFLNLGTPLLYIFVGVILKIKINPDQQYNRTIKQIFKAVFVIMILQLFGWLVNQILQVVMSYLNMDSISAWLLRNIAAFPLYIALGLDAPALYIFSHEYRKAFVQRFPCIAALLCKKSNGSNTIVPIKINVQKVSTIRMEGIDICNNRN